MAGLSPQVRWGHGPVRSHGLRSHGQCGPARSLARGPSAARRHSGRPRTV